MSESIAARLRQLARDHYEGRIAYDAYVRSRGELLDSLVGIRAESIEDTSVITQPRRSTGEFTVTTGEHPSTPAAPVAPATPAPSVQPAAPASVERTTGAFAAEAAASAANVQQPATPQRRATDRPGVAAPSAPPPHPQRRRTDTRPATTEFRPATGPHAAPAKPAAPSPTTAPPAAPATRKSISAVAIGGIVALVLGIAVSWLWLSGAYLKIFGRDAGTVVATGEAPNAARLLIDEFLLANDWSDATVAQFNYHWKTLAVEDRRAAFDSLWMAEFIETVRSHVKEQRALSAGEGEHRVAGPLAELAATFGIDVSAPDRVVIPSILKESQQPALPAPAPPVTQTAEAKPAPAKAEAETPATPPAKAPAATTQPQRREATPPRPAAPGQATPTAEKPAVAAGVTGEKQTQRECSEVPVRSRKPLCQDPLSIGGFGPAISLISVTPFPMGSTAAPEERPVHTVTLTKPFGLSMYEISQREFRTYCQATGRSCPPQPTEGEDLPVVNVTWHEARAYAEWLSSVTGQRYRLPSEAEWEYAARAGETEIYPGKAYLAPTDAWFSGIEKRTSVGPRNAGKLNAFNVAHMLGNAREWVLDGWAPNHEGAPADGTPRSPDAAGNRVVRGGSYLDTAQKLRLSLRDKLPQDTRDPTTGFRVAREIP